MPNNRNRKGSALTQSRRRNRPKPSAEVGQPGFKLKDSWVDILKEEDLRPQNFFCTIEEMSEDACVAHPLEFTQDLVTLGLMKGKWESTGTRKSDIIAEFMQHNMNSMDGMTWLDAIENFNTSIKWGFSLSEIVLKKETKGKFKGNYVLSKLAPRPQTSLHSWLWDEYEREITHVVQKPLHTTQYIREPLDFPYLGNITDIVRYSQSGLTLFDYPIIPKANLLHFTYNSSDSNPQGRSPLIACYRPWREKNVIQEYEIIGTTRDLGGIPLGRVPSDLIVNAHDPEGRYPEDEAQYNSYIDQLENIHAGNQASILLSSDQNDSGVYEYDLKLLGIDGSGKQFDISKMIEQKDAEIYNAFGAGFLTLGQGGSTSSYNLSTSGRSVHAFKVERDLIRKSEVLKSQLCKALLDANNLDYDHKDLPNYVYADPDQLSMDEAGKFIQRAKSVGGLTQEALEYIYRLAGIPYGEVDLLDFTSEDTSRAGESQGTSGTGSSQLGGVGSSVNVDNKQLVIDSYDDTEVVLDIDSQKVTFKGKIDDKTD